ncbi:transporter substrate-binding domain-containing protein [Legionella bononiensis]|uniref:Transporter substrate-binding domain-containing protein n=1 Tax=Legionella bononiensis TaxID=2793102 RepID=A0ABS1WBD5_9GAMM|nr:transporter substrate-binding domain-containing protein [Legionella bononiensis]MBL7480179.1 transporter substrate-binding domain-containing protein [Legionella bononiensis]MBL7526590.1 transporter substrate-binding domain-containing protein [Legionella bononiensis]MBL7562916.1 transporter substrate-binding domain-containing protein [Legionella bononiensis]
MNLFRHLILITFLFLMSPLHAIGEPLNVGIDSYTPPFVMEGQNNEYYGFDIDMITSLCKIMKRTCTFVPMRFEDLLAAVESKKVDIAVSAITITAERSKKVGFSAPYLLSYSRFLTNHTEEAHQAFSLQLLKDKKIGVVVATVFKDQIKDMGIINPTVIEYPNTEVMLEDLKKGKIDCVLFDNPTALYWAANSSGAFIVIGKPYLYGFGLGIAVNQTENNLLESVNQALKQYELSKEFKLSYSRYIESF